MQIQEFAAIESRSPVRRYNETLFLAFKFKRILLQRESSVRNFFIGMLNVENSEVAFRVKKKEQGDGVK